MSNWFNLLLLSLLTFPALTFAESDPDKKEIAKYVSVTFEIHGLEESANLLKGAMSSLASSMNEVAKSPENLSPDQIRALGLLVEKSAQLVVSLERMLKEIEPTIENVKKSSTELLSSLLQTTKSEAIDPTIKSIQQTIQFWIYLIVIAAIIIVILLGYTFYSSTRQFKEMAQIVKSIADDYEILPKERLRNKISN